MRDHQKEAEKVHAEILAAERAATERLSVPAIPTMDSTKVKRENQSQQVPFGVCIPRIKKFD